MIEMPPYLKFFCAGGRPEMRDTFVLPAAAAAASCCSLRSESRASLASFSSSLAANSSNASLLARTWALVQSARGEASTRSLTRSIRMLYPDAASPSSSRLGLC
eukprot:CAMPEP_0173412192 /NCGR_PEP_ID=MMETSP1356-20130122/78924_1 /TAXON_ID=77927 ORGANISM="Hemiselmis virescens, Strain PCC157" /NCGR_SAMPLE_ID=MMETSP1356 /ASSEMBLY_ACC=CAM_ASM_000847 /LENGTH=103 /DNA_ID=CAMNT_0014374053 /DNA_START=12 /DNA_END=320 /DNA_ORIENTATION=+